MGRTKQTLRKSTVGKAHKTPSSINRRPCNICNTTDAKAFGLSPSGKPLKACNKCREHPLYCSQGAHLGKSEAEFLVGKNGARSACEECRENSKRQAQNRDEKKEGAAEFAKDLAKRAEEGDQKALGQLLHLHRHYSFTLKTAEVLKEHPATEMGCGCVCGCVCTHSKPAPKSRNRKRSSDEVFGVLSSDAPSDRQHQLALDEAIQDTWQRSEFDRCMEEDVALESPQEEAATAVKRARSSPSDYDDLVDLFSDYDDPVDLFSDDIYGPL